MGRIKAIPISRQQANEFVNAPNRHHAATQGDKYRVGASVDGKLVGVVQVGRPVSRMLDDGETVEVTRLCTDGTSNVCSFLYSRAARIAEELGYARIITYILEDETGASLRAAGWSFDGMTRGGEWDCKSRPRRTNAPTCLKQRWAKRLKNKS